MSTTMDALSPCTISLDTMHSEAFLKMEDIHDASASPSPSPEPELAHSHSQSSPPPVVVQSKPAKKRKSWGQELPEPKTNLPPRKRAKTDDEKEQRRIERIKRNRAAAHNSRERKRQETETLAVALARANAELEAYRKLHGPLPASIVLPEVQVDRSEEGCADLVAAAAAAAANTPAPSLVESHGSQGDAASPSSPAESIFHHAHGHPKIKQEPLDHSHPPTFSSSSPSSSLDNLDPKSSLLHLDLTQHSAAMLCDLPCRSSLASNTTTGKTSMPPPSSWWTNLFLYLMATQLQVCYQTILVALWTLSPSRMARMMRASTLHSSRLTTSSSTTRLLRSTPRRLALPRAATGLSAPQGGARALTRQSLDEDAQTSKEELTTRQAQTRHDTKTALSERVLGTTEDQAMADDGE